MKIGGSRPVTGTGRVATPAGSPAAAADGPVTSARSIADTASVMGIPEGELTPKVRQAIVTLMAEVEDLRRRLDRTSARLAELERLADEDALVPLPNRRAFVRELSRVMSYAQRYGAPASLVYFDVNGFKEINDRLGHAAGDAALLRVAQVLIDNVRESDIVGRLGGDEFGVILIQADEARAAEKASLLAAEVRSRPLAWEGESLPLSLAYGICSLGGGGDAGDALAAADRAMYVHKQQLKGGS